MRKLYPQLCLPLLLLMMMGQQLYAGKAKGINSLTGYYFANRGQVTDVNGKTSGNVLFYNTGNRMSVFVTTAGYTLSVKQTDGGKATWHSVQVKLDNAHITAAQINMVKCAVAPALNFYTTATGRNAEDVHGSTTVLVKNIYPGIDWVWSITPEGQPQNDFMVNLGADAGLIKCTVAGGDLSTGANNITYANKGMRVTEGPVVYQQRDKTFAATISVKGTHYSFNIPDTLKGGGFTIDPPLALNWSAGLDTFKTAFRCEQFDAAYNSFTVGYSGDYALPVFPEQNGSYQSPTVQSEDVVIMKTDSDQNILWATFYGGSGNDQGNAIAVAPTGIFITGYSESWNLPLAVAGNYNMPVALTGRDAFIAKFTDNGIWKWATGYGGSGPDEGMDIKYFNGNIFVGGYTGSSHFPLQQRSGAYFYNDTSRTDIDGFVMQFDTACNRTWATCFGGKGDDYISSVWADATGLYVTGYSDTAGITTIPLQAYGSAYFQPQHNGTESFISMFNTADALQYSTFFGGQGKDYATCIRHDNRGLFICGKTNGPGLPVQSQGSRNFYQANYNGGDDGFILKLDPVTLQKQYCTYYGDTGNEALTKFSGDANGNLVFTGFSNSAHLPWYHSSQFFYTTNINAGGYDVVMLGLDSVQATFWSTFFGTSSNDFAWGVNAYSPYLVDVAGEALYNYGRDTIGGTYSFNGSYPLVTCNGESNRFYNLDSIGVSGGFGDGHITGGGGCGMPLYFQALIPLKNSCPNQCDGKAKVDTGNVNGCPPYSFLWNDGGVEASDSQLCENYWNRIYDSHGQHRTIYGRFNVLRVNALPTIKVSCSQIPNWNGLIQPKGGGPPYTITDRGSSGNGCPNTEYFIISDTANCVLNVSAEWDIMNSQLSAALSLDGSCKLISTLNSGNAECTDLSLGSGWTYVLNNGSDTMKVPFTATNGEPQGLLAGVQGLGYSGYLDMGSCSIPLNTVYDFAPIIDSVKAINDCNNNGTGSFTVRVQPDTGALHYLGSYQLNYNVYGQSLSSGALNFSSNAPQTFSLTGLSAGTYSVVLNVANSCSNLTTQVTVKNVDFTLSNTAVFCGKDSVLMANLVNATPPVVYNWQPGSSLTDTLRVAVPGTYQLTTTDINGCIITHSIYVPGSPGMILNVDENQAPCTNTLLTAATVSITGGAYPYAYHWNNGQSGASATGLSRGQDGVTVTDNYGCRDSVQFQNTKQLLMVLADTVSNITCYGLSDGRIVVSITDGYPPYQVQWSDGATGAQRTSLSADTYRYTVTDAKNCTASGQAVVTAPLPIILFRTTATPATCTASDGSALIYAAGGTGALSIVWNDSTRGFTNNNLPAGSIGFTISDSNNCRLNGSITVRDTNPLTAQPYQIGATCTGGGSDGSASVTLFNATAPVSYQWSTGSTAPYIFNVPGGIYYATSTDAKGCRLVDTLLIDSQAVPVVYIDTGFGIRCYGQTVMVTVSGSGGTAPYQGGYQQQKGAGSYTVLLTDDNGCSASAAYSLTEPPPLQTYNNILSEPDCQDTTGSLTEYTSGGVAPYGLYTYYTSSGNYFNSTTIAGLYSGTDSIRVTDANGCSISDAVYFTPYEFMHDSIVLSKPACYNGADGSILIIMTAGTGPFTISGSNQSFTTSYFIPFLAAGSYNYVITDYSGCTVSLHEVLNNPQLLQASFSIRNYGVCNTDTLPVEFFAWGGTQPYYNDSTVQFAPGVVTWVIVDTMGCTDTLTVNVPEIPPFAVDTFISQPACSNQPGILQIVPSQGFGAYTLTGDPSVSYNFSDTLTLKLPSGFYNYVVSNGNGCYVPLTFSITQGSSISGTVSSASPRCNADNNGSVTITMQSGTAPYFTDSLYFTDSVTFSNLMAGNYLYTVVDLNGCSTALSVNLTQPQPLLLDTPYLTRPITCRSDRDAICDFNITGGTVPYNYLLAGPLPGTGTISSNAGNFTDMGAGSYMLTLTDSKGCSSNFNVEVPPYQPSVDSLVVSNVTCYGHNNGVIKVYAANHSPYTYSLNGNTPQVYNVFYNLPAGNYQVVVSDQYNCIDTLDSAIAQPDSIDGRVWLNGLLLPVDTVTLNAETPADFTRKTPALWTASFSPNLTFMASADTLIEVLPVSNTAYVIDVYMDSSDRSCFVQYNGLITVAPAPELPNMMTPNHDGINDKWEIDLYKYPHPQLIIFDRWGETVYRSDDYANNWDGTYLQTGRSLPDGSYYYILTVPAPVSMVIKGNINILDSPR